MALSIRNVCATKSRADSESAGSNRVEIAYRRRQGVCCARKDLTLAVFAVTLWRYYLFADLGVGP